MTGWTPDISQATKPRYLAIADSIADDVTRGRLRPSERLPTQRQLATILDIDFTTVARGYAEAQRRGLVEARVGQGTFVTGLPPRSAAAAVPRPESADLSLNLPPEPTDPGLLLRMRAGLEAIGRDMPSLLRYQNLRRQRGGQGCGGGLAWLPGPDTAAGADLHRLRGSCSLARDPRQPRQAWRCRPVGSIDLSRNPLGRGPTRTDSDRPAAGRGGAFRRCVCGSL